jgi:hypothetical protein
VTGVILAALAGAAAGACSNAAAQLTRAAYSSA